MFLLVASILTPAEHFLRHILNWFHFNVGLTWAWSIVALTVLVRMLLVPLTIRQIHGMQALQKHAPEMKAIQQRYKGDKQRQNEELMKFYRENNINPAASCLPLLAQFPVFIALYYTLRSFSRHPPPGDLSWLHIIPDISAKTTSSWGGYLLLVVYVASQMVSTLYMSATMDKTQKRIIMFMPLIFVFVIAHFPAGLVLYWMTTNLWTVGQGLVTRRLVSRTPAPAPAVRSSRTPPQDDDKGGGNGARKKPTAPKPTAPAKAKSPQSSQPARPVRRKKKARR